jgi:hypothetical protein
LPSGLPPEFSPEHALRALLKAFAAAFRQVVEADGYGWHLEYGQSYSWNDYASLLIKFLIRTTNTLFFFNKNL